MESRPSPLILVHPSRGLLDEKISILVQNLPPVLNVTLRALINSDDGDFWEAFGHYVSDSSGMFNAVEEPSLGGTYDGIDPMGLIWSMRPVPGSRTGLRLRKNEVHSPYIVHISAYKGHLSQGFKEQTALTTVIVERWYMAPGVRRVEITEGGLKAALFLPPGLGPFPGLLDLWGGGGGLVEYRSALLASHGYVSLALEYLNQTAKDPTTQVGKEYFEAAFTLLKEHPQVCGDRIAIMGLSFGASVALGMAVYSTVIQPRCLVCVSGSHVHPVKSSLADVFAEINKNVKNTRFDENNQVIWRDLLLPIPKDPAKKVDVGRLQCPVLMVVGEDDQNWPASESAEDMREMMQKAGNSDLLSILSYPKTGHLIEPPYSPHVRSSNFITVGKKMVVLWGGETVPHCRSQEDAWEKTLDFLEEHLYRSSALTIPTPSPF